MEQSRRLHEGHFEPCLCVSGLTHKSVLISWGGFYFKLRREEGDWKVLDDGDLDRVQLCLIGACVVWRWLFG